MPLIVFSLLGCNPPVDNNDTQTKTSVEITWRDMSDNETEFVISRRYSDETEFTVLNYLDKNTTSYIDYDIDKQYGYCYKITSSNEIGDSDSNEMCITF